MMTPEERDRLAKAEQAIADMREDISAITKRHKHSLRQGIKYESWWLLGSS